MTARTAVLTDQLVELITGFSQDNNARLFKACKDASLRSLKSHRFGRTNQFTVRNSLDGLVEKFSILGKEPLANALEERLDELKGKKQTKFLPESLSLLLLLSDHPAEAASVEALQLVNVSEDPLPPTWQELIAHDPITKEELWDAPDYASSDDGITQELSEVSQDTALPSINEDAQVDVESLLVPTDHAAFNQLMSEHKWRTQIAGQPILELHIIRESIHMLRGLPSILYDKTSRSKKLIPNHDIKVHGVSDSTIYGLLSVLANAGTTISFLRVFVSKYRKSPLLQTFCAAIQNRLGEFDKMLTKLEADFVQPTTSVVIASLLRVEAAVQEQVESFNSLSQAIINAQTPSLSASLQSPGKVPNLDTQPHRLLDFLYDQVCDAHSSCNSEVFKTLAHTFFACIDTYLRPIHDWMQHGDLTEDPDFPIAIIEMDVPKKAGLSTFWYDRYGTRQSHVGRPEAPRFLYPHLAKILVSGKSVAFGRKLGLEASSLSMARSIAPELSSIPSMRKIDPLDLVPFEETFACHLDHHIASLYKHTSRELVNHLLNHDSGVGLLRITAALKTIYLSADGVLFDIFARDIYALVLKTRAMGDSSSKLMITGCAQRVFAESPTVNPALISASTIPLANTGQKVSMSKRLAQIHISYMIPPSMQNIIVPSSSGPMYSAALTLLLQLRYSLVLVRQVVFALPHLQTQRLILHIRHRLLHALSTLEDYLFNLVISPAISILDKRFSNAQDVDELISAHEAFTHDISTGCFEAGKKTEGIRRIVTALCDLAVLFANEVERSRVGGQPVSSNNGDIHKHKEPDEPGEHAMDAIDTGMGDKRLAAQADLATLSVRDDAGQARALAKLRHIRAQVIDLLSMLVAHLRSGRQLGAGLADSVVQTNEEDRWEMLADRLS